MGSELSTVNPAMGIVSGAIGSYPSAVISGPKVLVLIVLCAQTLGTSYFGRRVRLGLRCFARNDLLGTCGEACHRSSKSFGRSSPVRSL